MKTVFLTIGLLALAIVMLGVKALFVKGGKFPQGHAHQVMAKWRKLHGEDGVRMKGNNNQIKH